MVAFEERSGGAHPEFNCGANSEEIVDIEERNWRLHGTAQHSTERLSQLTSTSILKTDHWSFLKEKVEVSWLNFC